MGYQPTPVATLSIYGLNPPSPTKIPKESSEKSRIEREQSKMKKTEFDPSTTFPFFSLRTLKSQSTPPSLTFLKSSAFESNFEFEKKAKKPFQ